MPTALTNFYLTAIAVDRDVSGTVIQRFTCDIQMSLCSVAFCVCGFQMSRWPVALRRSCCLWHADVAITSVAFRRFCTCGIQTFLWPVACRRFCTCGIQTLLRLRHSDISVACGMQTSLWPVAFRPLCGLWHADLSVACGMQT